MFEYSVFGGCVRSEIEFPELPGARDTDSKWTLRIVSTRPARRDFELLGEDEVETGVSVRLYRHGDGFHLDFDDTGTFLISSRGSIIEWCPGPKASIEAARLDFLGRVLAVALHQQGIFCLHASAVAMRGGAIAFLAPKFHGKSTLAFALLSAGAKLVTDDTLPVHLGSPVEALPGVHQLRLWEDSASRAGRLEGRVQSGPGGKLLLTDLKEEQCVQSPLPLAAIYLVSPSRVTLGVPVSRERLTSAHAALPLVAHSKLGPLLQRSAAPELFENAAAVARSVPVYTLKLDRGFPRLDEVVARLQGWHAGSRPAVEPSI